MTLHPRSGGFTLLELVLSASVTAGVVGGAYLCLQAGLKSQKLAEARADIAQNARVALARMAADLRSACPLEKDLEFVGTERTLGGLALGNLDFATHHWSPRSSGEGDFCEVSYFVNRNPDTGQLGLWRRQDPSPDSDPLGGGTREEIAVGLRSLSLEYYDGWTWYRTWGPPAEAGAAGEGGAAAGGSSERSPSLFGGFNLDGLPEAVRITLAFADPAPFPDRRTEEGARLQREDAEPPLVFQTVVRLELAARAASASFASSSTGADASSGAGTDAGGAQGAKP